MKKALFFISIFISFTKTVRCSLCGSGDWIAFEDEKCFKFVDRVVNREKAEQICNNHTKGGPTLNSLPTLVSIKSQREQQFLERYLFEISGALDSVWISAKRKIDSENEFEWSDGSDLKYENWGDGYHTNNTDRKCVEMQSAYFFKDSTNLIKSSTVGRWVDIPCQKSNFAVCEKMQTWSFPQLQKSFLDARKELKESLEDVTKQLNDTRNQLNNTENELATTKNELINTKTGLNTTTNNLNTQLVNANNKLEALQKNPIPIGFVYVQLPDQPELQDLWESVNWTEITSDYSGLFFRVLGEDSAHFGAIQEQSSPRLTEVKYIRQVGQALYDINVYSNNEWSSPVESGGDIGTHGLYAHLSFKVSNDKVRPRNKAIRIWKRS